MSSNIHETDPTQIPPVSGSVLEQTAALEQLSAPSEKTGSGGGLVASGGESESCQLSEVQLNVNESPALETASDSSLPAASEPNGPRKRKKRRLRNKDAAEQRLLGRQNLCKRIEEIAPKMLKTVKLRVLGRFLESTRGLQDEALTNQLIQNSDKLAGEERIRECLKKIDPDVNRRMLKAIILYTILLQEETFSLEENRLAEKVVEYESKIVALSEKLDFFDARKHDATRAHHYDTYRIVLEAAWRNDEDISQDEAALLVVLRKRLNISEEEHRLIEAHIQRFPKRGCGLHTADEVHEARKELQRDGILWSYRDENNNNIDVIPYEIAGVLRHSIFPLQLQKTNYQRLLQNDRILLVDLKKALQDHDMDASGAKAELIDRLAESDLQPAEVLDVLDRAKLSEMCRLVGLKSSGNKPELIERLIYFYDDLSFVERETQDEREDWYNNYELLASRQYADLRAKKVITKDLDVEHQFEAATDFLFEVMLNLDIDNSRKLTKADGRIPLEDRECILWDCKSCEGAMNLQDYLDTQFDDYLTKERQQGNRPLAFLVVAPSFTPQSLKLAYQYKARTNWDIALIEAAALKNLAEQWNATESEKPFPIRLLNRTQVIDMNVSELLLSLA